jgi:hypothetical protein
MTTTIEQILTRQARIPASPLQLAVCRASEGQDIEEDLLTDDGGASLRVQSISDRADDSGAGGAHLRRPQREVVLRGLRGHA